MKILYKNLNFIYLLSAITLFLLFSNNFYAQKKKTTKNESKVVNLQLDKVNYLLSASEFAYSPNGSVRLIKRQSRGYYPAGTNKKSPNVNMHVQWKINSPKEETYMVEGLTIFPKGVDVQLVSESETVTFKSPDHGEWDRFKMGEIKIPAGESVLKLKADNLPGQFQMRSLEVIAKPHYPKHLELIKDYKEKGLEANFKDLVYGVCFTWGNWALAPDGSKKPFPQNFIDFDIEKWADQMVEFGVGYVLFSTSWGEFYFGAPIKTIESINPNRTTVNLGDGYDFYGKVADALNKRGIRMLLYFHHGQGDGRRYEGSTWWNDFHTKPAAGVTVKNPNDRQEVFYENYKAIVSEIGERYGEKLYGWWFDDYSIMYPKDFYELSKIYRKGNPNRVVAFNNGRWPRYSEFQDYVSGENHGSFDKADLDENGALKEGRNKGLLAHRYPRMENHWAVYSKAPKIFDKPNNITGMPGAALDAAKNGYLMTFNLMMYEDGTMAPSSVEGMKNAKKAMEEAGYERDFSPINQD